MHRAFCLPWLRGGLGRGLIASLIFLALQSTLHAADKKKPANKSSNWPSFRGHRAAGVAEGKPTATEWDVPRNKNVLWKTEIPGLGYSCPVIWGDKVFVTTAIRQGGKERVRVGLYGDIMPVKEQDEHIWRVCCLDRKSGNILWQHDAYQGIPKVKRHPKGSHANCTPATDGKHLVVFFASEGLYCYDLEGALLWQKDLGTLDSGYYEVPDAQWEFASSPIIHKGKIILQCDIQKNSFLTCLDIKDGNEVWLTPRKEVPTWGTPTILETQEGDQIICNGYKHIGAYDFKTGKEVWKLRGGGDIPVPTPVTANDTIFITNGHGMMNPIYAIKATAKGKLTLGKRNKKNVHVAWWQERSGTYMQTPIVYKGKLYACRDNGVLSCYELANGKQVYTQRLGKGLTGFTASPVAADGKLYFTSEPGEVYVIQAGPDFKVLATNPLGEVCMSTPAISDGVLFFHTNGHIVAIAESQK